MIIIIVPLKHWHQIINPFNEPVHIIEIQYGDECIEEDIERINYVGYNLFLLSLINLLYTIHLKAGWQSGYAAACKAVYAGSIPDSASNNMNLDIFIFKSIYKLKWRRDLLTCPSGGIGRHKGLKIPR